MDSKRPNRERIYLWDQETFICPEGEKKKKKKKSQERSIKREEICASAIAKMS